MANALQRRGSLTIWFEPGMIWPGMTWDTEIAGEIEAARETMCGASML